MLGALSVGFGAVRSGWKVGGLATARRWGTGKSPLEGIKVLDMSRVLAGPYGSQILADLGCDVLKVEKPGFGDDTRFWGPPYWVEGNKGKTEGGEDEEGKRSMAAYFVCLNRGKRSVEVDFSTEEGKATIKKLAAKADVLIENYKADGLAKYGLGYDDIAKINPKIVYCSITGFGQKGPLAQNAGYDFLIQGMGGLMSVTGTPESGPLKTGVAVTDIMTGLYSVIGIQAALRERENSGKGQHLDMSLYDTQLAMMVNQGAAALVTGQPPKLLGNAHPSVCPYDAVQCKDDLIILAVGNDSQFERFCKAIGAPELPESPLYSTNDQRVTNRQALLEHLKKHLSEKTVEEWISILGPLGVPAGPINSLSKALNHPQTGFREMVVSMDIPPEKTDEPPTEMKMVGTPIKMSRSNCQASSPPPFLGQHTEEALSDWLGEGWEKE